MKFAKFYIYGEDEFNKLGKFFNDEDYNKMESVLNSERIKMQLEIHGKQFEAGQVMFRFEMKNTIRSFIEYNSDVKIPKKVKSQDDLIKWVCNKNFTDSLFFDVSEKFLMRVDFFTLY